MTMHQVNTAIMGNWFPKKGRGLIFGLWTCHQVIKKFFASKSTCKFFKSPVTSFPYPCHALPYLSSTVRGRHRGGPGFGLHPVDELGLEMVHFPPCGVERVMVLYQLLLGPEHAGGSGVREGERESLDT